MPISIVIPKMKDYPIVDKWIRESEKHFLSGLNHPDHPKNLNEDYFEKQVIQYFLDKYPLSAKDLDGMRVHVGFDYAMGQY